MCDSMAPTHKRAPDQVPMQRRRSVPYYIKAGLSWCRGPECLIGKPEKIALYLCHEANGDLTVFEVRNGEPDAGMCLTRDQERQLCDFMAKQAERRGFELEKIGDAPMEPQDLIRNGGRNGWVCPVCGRVYSPDVTECPRCSGDGERPQRPDMAVDVHIVEDR